MNAAGTRVYLTGAVWFLGIAVFGSLHPFDFHRVPFTAAVARFWDAEVFDPLMWSATDVVSNFMLFVPIGVCAAAALRRISPPRLGAIVFAAGLVLSAAIELGQAFVSWRTPSIIDVVTEGIGMAAGAAIWYLAQRPIDRVVMTAIAPCHLATMRQRLLLIYVGAFSWFWLLPFNVTIVPAEIIDKYEHLRLLLPFSPSPHAASAVELRIMAAAAVPIGMAGVMFNAGGRGHAWIVRGFFGGVCFLLVLTFAQMFVFSRTTDATLIVAALPGVALGAAAARLGVRAATGIAR